jgi:hypothetical protein
MDFAEYADVMYEEYLRFRDQDLAEEEQQQLESQGNAATHVAGSASQQNGKVAFSSPVLAVAARSFANQLAAAAPAVVEEQQCEEAGCECGEGGVVTLECKGEPPRQYYAPWVRRFIEDGATGTELMREQCSGCQQRRAKRRRVMTADDYDRPELKQPPFDTAPALYAYNVPRYYTVLLRAREYARAHGLQLSWCVARDVPLTREDRDLPLEQLDAKRRRWLENHDQHTSHIASQVPCVAGLPVRLTDTVDRRRQLFRGRRGRIVGWAPHPEEERIDVDGEWLLTRMPQCIYIFFPGATWTVHDDLGVGVYPLTPVSRTWKPGKTSSVKIRRTGFFIVPDFASTAHMIQGQSLDAAFVDIVHDDMMEPTTEELQVAGYTMLSRAKYLENLWIMRPFSPHLFRRGAPTGPRVLMERLTGKLGPEGVREEFDQAARQEEAAKVAKQDEPMQVLYRCAQCALTGRTPCMRPPLEFGAMTPSEILPRIIADGGWARCMSCRAYADERRKERGMPPAYGPRPCIAAAEGTQEDALWCKGCEQRLPPDRFDARTLRNRGQASSFTCISCHGLQYCIGCKGWKRTEKFRSNSALCTNCQPISCAGCGVTAPAGQYEATERLHFFSHGQNVCCATCRGKGVTPRSGQFRAISAPSLLTCSGCNKQLPTNSFRRKGSGSERGERCKGCELIVCAACSLEVPATTFGQKEVAHYFNDGQKCVCAVCKEKGCTAKDTKYYQCRATLCGQFLGRRMFDETELRHSGPCFQELHCKSCRARQAAGEKVRLSSLRGLAATSRRKKCNCGTRAAHSEKCPMHQRRAGERPYPYCDVMSREDSEWYVGQVPARADKSKRR